MDEQSDLLLCYDAFCESLDNLDDKQKRIDLIDDAIHRLLFERRWQSLTPEQVKHMCDESLSEAEHAALANASGKRHDELVTMYARARYFRRCAWVSYLNGETGEPPLASTSS